MRSLRTILVLAGKNVRILLRMPAILLVIFMPGIVMYTVFTCIFEGPAGVSRPFRAAVIDLDDTEASHALIDALSKSNVIVVRTEDESPTGRPLTIESARQQIRKEGKYRVAVVIPKGFSQAPNAISGKAHQGVELIHDETQPLEANAIVGMLQMAAGRVLYEQTFGMLGRATASRPIQDGKGESEQLLKVRKSGVAIERMQISAKYTFLAGVVPLFLLFTSVGAARGLLDEISRGATRRLLAAPLGPVHILLSQQLYAFLLAFAQCVAMYVFAWLVFGVEIWRITGGLTLLTAMTCLATTGFGMLLASICRTAEQLDAIGTTVVLAMSAIGGSMVPRFIMPPFMQKLGLYTINGWAYDGFIALIRNEGVWGIKEECLVLATVASACAALGSILLSRRLRAAPAG